MGRKIHYKVDDEPTLCGVHHFTDESFIDVSTSLESVTCGNCRRKVTFREAKPLTQRRVKKYKKGFK